MSIFRKNKFILGLLLTAVLSLVIFSVGGEYLHSCIHKHESQAAHQQCPVYQLQAQTFTTVGAVLAALFVTVVFINIRRCTQVFISQSRYILPDSHAPPVSLS